MDEVYGLINRLRELANHGRKIDRYEYEKGEFGNHRFDLFEKGEFVETMILYCHDKDIVTVKDEIEKELAH